MIGKKRKISIYQSHLFVYSEQCCHYGEVIIKALALPPTGETGGHHWWLLMLKNSESKISVVRVFSFCEVTSVGGQRHVGALCSFMTQLVFICSPADNQLLCRSLKHLDECKYKIPPLEKKYDLQNMEPKTTYHCDCTSR